MDKRFTVVPGFSDRRRIPLLGKIRLGIKAVSKNSGKEYPKEVDYFVVPDEVKAVYGDNPKKLDVMFPTTDRSMIFPCSMRRYGSTAGLKCIGNGQQGYDVVTKKDVECPCKYYTGIDSGQECKVECNRVGFLFVILYKVNLGGVYQIRTSSANTVTDVMSGFDYIEGLLRRPFNMIPLILERQQIETHFDQKKQIHFPLKLYPQFNIEQANLLIQDTRRIYTDQFMLPAPKDENPAIDSETPTVTEVIDDEKPNELAATVTEPVISGEPTVELIKQQVNDIDNLADVHLDVIYSKLKEIMKSGNITKEQAAKMAQDMCPFSETIKELSRLDLLKLYYRLKSSGGDLKKYYEPKK